METGEQVFSDTDTEPEEKEEEVEGIKIRFSLFFDGTLNNRANVEAREKKTFSYRFHWLSGSYKNDRSNVARMEPHVDVKKTGEFKHVFKSYIEGIGTLNDWGDFTVGASMGTGLTGVKAKVTKGLNDVVNQMQGVSEIYGATIDELVIDVFGFSRGAAAARYFVHQVLNEKATGRGRNRRLARPMAQRLRAVGFKIENANVKFKFVGLYDTVASEGTDHSDDTPSLKLDSISRANVENVVQLAAAAEHRKNFPLTTIESAGGRGREIFLPGVHSDIGGGYREDTEEKLLLYKSYSRDEVEADMKRLQEAGWYRDGEIWIVDPPPTPPFNPAAGVPGVGYVPPMPQKYRLKVHREKVSNHYSKIALHIMADFSREAQMKIKRKLENKESVPSGLLASVRGDLMSYARRGGSSVSDWEPNGAYPWLPDLHNGHLHFSSHYGKTAGVIEAMKPNLLANGKRARLSYYG